jgi:UDP-N-acetylglucosamine 2-epimerase
VTQYFWPESFRINDLALGLKEEGHERPEGMDETIVIMAGLELQRVVDAVRVAITHYAGSQPPSRWHRTTKPTTSRARCCALS